MLGANFYYENSVIHDPSLTVVLDAKRERDDVTLPLNQEHGLHLEPALVHAPVSKHPAAEQQIRSSNKPQPKVKSHSPSTALLRLLEICAGLLDGAQQVGEGHHGAHRGRAAAAVPAAEAVGRQVDGRHAVDTCSCHDVIQPS